MAGFRGPLFLLGLAALSTTQGGFNSPLPAPPISGTGAVTQGGFNSPLPAPPIGGGAAQQAGFISPIPLTNLGAGEAEVEPPTTTGGGFVKDTLKRQIEREDDEILTIIMAALTIMEQA